MYYYKVKPFGQKNAGARYHKLVNHMFSKQIGRNMKVYVDDMLVKSKKAQLHLDDLRETFDTLRKYQMILNSMKCVFRVLSRKFLGFMISQRGIEANPKKVKAILNMTSLRSVEEVQRLTERITAQGPKADLLHKPSLLGHRGKIPKGREIGFFFDCRIQKASSIFPST